MMQPQGSNLKIFFIFIILLLSTSSCDLKKNDVIPDVFVDFTIDLVSDPYFFDLAASPGNSITISSSTNNWGSRAGGYDGNGIIIYNTSMEYFAFDRTCPHCYVTGNTSIAVNIDGINAVCPRCGSVYVMPSYGTPQAGSPSQYPLKNYRTEIVGQYLRVWNNRY